MIVASYTVAGLAVGLMLLVVLVWRKKCGQDKTPEPNYRTFFIMGIAWCPIGIVCTIVYGLLGLSFVIGVPLIAMGAIYLSIGLANRDKWKKPD